MSNIYETAPAIRAAAVTPHASNPLSGSPRALYVGGTGDIACRLHGDTADVTFVAIPAGSILPIKASHVRISGTSATYIVALY